MKLGILSRNLRCYSTRRLREAAQQRGHKIGAGAAIEFDQHLLCFAQRNKGLAGENSVDGIDPTHEQTNGCQLEMFILAKPQSVDGDAAWGAELSLAACGRLFEQTRAELGGLRLPKRWGAAPR